VSFVRFARGAGISWSFRLKCTPIGSTIKHPIQAITSKSTGIAFSYTGRFTSGRSFIFTIRIKRRLSLQFKRQRKENQKLLSSKLLMVSEVKPSVGGRNQRFNQEAL
jgi:hypothetical protein